MNGVESIGMLQAPVDCIIFDRTRDRIIATSRDGIIAAFNVTTGSKEIIHRTDPEMQYRVAHRLALDGDILLCGCTDGTIMTISLDNNSVRNIVEATSAVSDVAVSPSGHYAVVGGSYDVMLFDRDLNRIWAGETYKFPYSVTFTQSGSKMLVGCWDGDLYEVSMSDLPVPEVDDETGEQKPAQLAYARMPYGAYLVFKARYLNDSNVVYCGHRSPPDEPETGCLYIWNQTTNQHEHSFIPSDGVHDVAVSPTGEYIAAGGNDRTVWLWKMPEFDLVVQWEFGEAGPAVEELDETSEFALRVKRRGIAVEGFDEIEPPAPRDDPYYPACIEFYHASGPGAVHTLAFHPERNVLYVGTHGGGVYAIGYGLSAIGQKTTS